LERAPLQRIIDVFILAGASTADVLNSAFNEGVLQEEFDPEPQIEIKK
jgi:hypothetical protein